MPITARRAIQGAKYAATEISNRLQDKAPQQAFKYYDKVQFLHEDRHTKEKKPRHSEHFEVKTILSAARAVDDLWILDRKNCDELCVAYRSMVELSQKYYLRRWTHCREKWNIHDLLKLNRLIAKHNTHLSIAQCTDESLIYVTQCGEHTKYRGVEITCNVFYHHAQFVDPYVQSLWAVMQKIEPYNQ